MSYCPLNLQPLFWCNLLKSMRIAIIHVAVYTLKQRAQCVKYAFGFAVGSTEKQKLKTPLISIV